MTKIKCVVIGSEFSGKTCLISKFFEDSGIDCLDGVGNPHSNQWLNEKDKYVTVLDDNYLLQVFDTPAGSDYERIRRLIYTDVDVFVICFSVISVPTFDSVTELWMPELRAYQKSLIESKKIPYILVGLQCDLRNEKVVANLGVERPIQPLEGQDLAQHIGAFDYFECSSFRNEGVNDIFEGAINAFNDAKRHDRHESVRVKKKKRKHKFKCSLM